jgi:ERF superfamily
MKTSETIDQLSAALAAAQGALKNPPKNKINPHFKSAYVDLSDGLSAVRECFSKHGLTFIQGTSLMDNIIVLNTRIAHKSGQWIESDYPVGGYGKPQEMGSAMTYARRYALFAMVGVAGEDDDDGNAAQAAETTPIKGKAAPRQMEPGLSPTDSEKLMGVIKAAMNMCENPSQLSSWATDHKDQVAMLLPAHRKELEEHYKKHRDELKANG